MGVLEDAFGSLIEEYISDNARDVAETVGEYIDTDAIADKVKEELDYEERLDTLENLNLDDVVSAVEDFENRIGELESHDSNDTFSRDDLETDLRQFVNLGKNELCSLGRAFNEAVESVIDREVKQDTEWQVNFGDAMVDYHPWFALVTDRLTKLENEAKIRVAEAQDAALDIIQTNSLGFGVMWGRHQIDGQATVWRRVVTGFTGAEAAREWAIANTNGGEWMIVATVHSSRL